MPQKLLGGKVSMLVPAGLTPMDESAKRMKYPGRNAPAFVRSNADGSVNVLRQPPVPLRLNGAWSGTVPEPR